MIHNDANDHNVIVSADRRTVSLIDFGDIVYAPRVCGLAVACAYAMLGQEQPGAGDPAARSPATTPRRRSQPAELSGALPADPDAAHDERRRTPPSSYAEQPGNRYLAISQEPIAIVLAKRLDRENPELAHYRFRDACGYRPVPSEREVVAYLASAPAEAGPRDPPRRRPRLGGYLERRDWYHGDAFATDDPGERRTVHLVRRRLAARRRTGPCGVRRRR